MTSLLLDGPAANGIALIAQAIRLAVDIAPAELPQQLGARLLPFRASGLEPVDLLLTSIANWSSSELCAQLGIRAVIQAERTFPMDLALPGGTLTSVIDLGDDEPSVALPYPGREDQAIVGMADGTIRIMQFSTGMTLTKFAAHAQEINCLDLSPDNQFLMTACRAKINVWRLATHELVMSHAVGELTAASFLTDDVIVHFDRTTVNKIAFPSGETIASYKLRSFGASRRNCFAMSRERAVASIVLPFEALLLDLHSGGVLWTAKSLASCDNAGFCGDHVVYYSASEQEFRFVDINSGAIVETLATRATDQRAPEGIISLPTGIAILAYREHLVRYSLATRSREFVMRGQRGFIMGISACGNQAVSVSGGFGSPFRALHRWDLAARPVLLPPTPHRGYVYGIALVCDGACVASGADDGDLVVWDCTSGNAVRTLKGHTLSINQLVTLPNGHLLSTSDDTTVRLWDPAAGRELRVFHGHTALVRTVAINSTATRAVSVDDLRMAIVWDLETGVPLLKTRTTHTDAVAEALFLPGDDAFVTVSFDASVAAWSSTTGALEREYPSNGQIFRGALLFAGRLVAYTAGGTVLSWDPATGAALGVVSVNKDGIAQLLPLSTDLLACLCAPRHILLLDAALQPVSMLTLETYPVCGVVGAAPSPGALGTLYLGLSNSRVGALRIERVAHPAAEAPITGNSQDDDHIDVADALVARVLAGDVAVVLPPRHFVVRGFPSATFTDTQVEQDALMQRTYPRLRALARQRGLEFQMVSMRWGVTSDAGDRHQTTDLCLTELEACKRESAGVTFVSLLGQKYGYRPLPAHIPQSEFEAVHALARTVRVAETGATPHAIDRVITPLSATEAHSTSSIAIAARSLSGWLTKRGHIFKTWHQRYFELVTGPDGVVISYYRNESRHHKLGEFRPHKVLPMSECACGWPGYARADRCFGLVGVSGGKPKTYYLIANTPADVRQWIACVAPASGSASAP
eukprot:m.57298 g.57298  ORF g.57298 m.57298 type:complete len:980 (-) comp6824_c0_seq3:227-3166(-)